MPFAPGESGNPAGRPKKLEEQLRALRAELQAMTGGARWFANKLIDFVEHAPDHKDKLVALKLMLEYGYGKPVQNVQLEAQGDAALQIVVLTGVPQAERASQPQLVEAQAKVIEPNPLTMNTLPVPVEGNGT